MSGCRGTGEGDTIPIVQKDAARMHESSALDNATMRRFDQRCLTPVEPMCPDEIRALREKAGMSQALLARILNVTSSTVFQWERGDKKPTGSALKLLALIRVKGVGAVL